MRSACAALLSLAGSRLCIGSCMAPSAARASPLPVLALFCLCARVDWHTLPGERDPKGNQKRPMGDEPRRLKCGNTFGAWSVFIMYYFLFIYSSLKCVVVLPRPLTPSGCFLLSVHAVCRLLMLDDCSMVTCSKVLPLYFCNYMRRLCPKMCT